MSSESSVAANTCVPPSQQKVTLTLQAGAGGTGSKVGWAPPSRCGHCLAGLWGAAVHVGAQSPLGQWQRFPEVGRSQSACGKSRAGEGAATPHPPAVWPVVSASGRLNPSTIKVLTAPSVGLRPAATKPQGSCGPDLSCQSALGHAGTYSGGRWSAHAPVQL